MTKASPCESAVNISKSKIVLYTRKLRMLNFIKDSLERKLSAVKASIDTLERQISEADQLASQE